MLTIDRNQETILGLTTEASAEQTVAYCAALDLVAWIDEALTFGTAHLWRKSSGCLIETFDEAISAAIEHDIAVGSKPYVTLYRCYDPQFRCYIGPDREPADTAEALVMTRVQWEYVFCGDLDDLELRPIEPDKQMAAIGSPRLPGLEVVRATIAGDLALEKPDYIAPRRIQRRRIKGWRLPPGAIVCDRTTSYLGNPFNWQDVAGHCPDPKAATVDAFRQWLDGDCYPLLEERRQKVLSWLAQHWGQSGLVLVCWCDETESCHVDEYIERLRR